MHIISINNNNRNKKKLGLLILQFIYLSESKVLTYYRNRPNEWTRSLFIKNKKKLKKNNKTSSIYKHTHTHTHTYIDYYDEEEEKKIFKQYIK